MTDVLIYTNSAIISLNEYESGAMRKVGPGPAHFTARWAYNGPRMNWVKMNVGGRYVSSWFVMDAASSIPYEAVGYLLTGKHKVGCVYYLFGILRFWRLRRVKQYFTRFISHFPFHFIYLSPMF